MSHLALNQYRQGSGYKDVVGRLYHFPNRYLKAFSELPSYFVYYEPREGGKQVYFGTGKVSSVYDDTEDIGHAYAEVSNYEEFPMHVNFYSKTDGGTWEDARTMRNSVRRITGELFRAITAAGGVRFTDASPLPTRESLTESLQRELRSLNSGLGSRSPSALRRIRRIIESYERPSFITNYVKQSRGESCQICGLTGFLKRDGKRYCEVHHLFHLAAEPPADCLDPEYVIVVCANCHRRLHYAQVDTPISTDEGWSVTIDGEKFLLKTRHRDSYNTGVEV